MARSPEDPVLRSSRREALVVLLVCLAALTYSVTYCYLNGYNQPPESLTLVLGFPSWVFWGIVVPWVICCLISAWFSFGFIRDADLGEDTDEENLP